MAVDVTLDSVVRHNLAMRKLPLHFYGPMLVFAKRGLEEMHFDSLQKLKTAVLTLDTTLKTATLPVDFVEEVLVGVEVNDKVRPIGYNHRINTRDDGGIPFEQGPSIYTVDSGYLLGGILLENYFNEYGDFKGRHFGRPVISLDSYTILRDLGKIRVDNGSDITKVHLIYLSMPEKVSNKSVIHPFAQQSLHSWIDWQWAKHNKDKDQELRRRDFYNDYRILRARKNKMTTVEIKRVVRNKFGLAIKN